MNSKKDELWHALEGLRHRPVVIQARRYAGRWTASRRRLAAWQGLLTVPRLCLAAGCAAVAALALLAPIHELWPQKDSIATAIGEIRTEQLPDGSRVTLNTNTRLRIAFDAKSRDVELIEGQAHFEVAKEGRRPFRVRTSATEVVAVGTIFDVSSLPNRTTVTLIEGRVNVVPIAPSGRLPVEVETLTAGQQLGIASDGRVLGKRIARLESVTAWQRGSINLDDIPLAEALAEVNRYSTTKIEVADSSLWEARISGVFRTGDTDAVVAALERYFDLRAERRSAQSVMLVRTAAAD